MIKINRKVEYALMALKFMGGRGPEALTTAREVCDHFDIPFDTTSKVMQVMNQYGILKSSQGVKGGYGINVNLSEITYLELAQLIEKKQYGAECDNGGCELSKKCNITGPVKRLNQYVLTFFSGVTLKDLLDDHSLLTR